MAEVTNVIFKDGNRGDSDKMQSKSFQKRLSYYSNFPYSSPIGSIIPITNVNYADVAVLNRVFLILVNSFLKSISALLL